MPYYCTVPRCTSMAGKAKNVSFHQFPRDDNLAKLWNKILKRGKPYTKYSKVCSLHFTPDDYTITSGQKNKGQWRTLRKDAIPSRNLPKESPAPYQRRASSWTPPPPAMIDARMHQQMAQAIYVQTVLAMQAASISALNNGNEQSTPEEQEATSSPLTSPLATENTDTHMENTHNLEYRHTNDSTHTFKCGQCSKCFKDPDVFLLHQRSHTRNNEAGNTEEMLKANPILANLLNSNAPQTSTRKETGVFDVKNVKSIENQIMAALTANMENYLRNLSTIMTNGNTVDSEDFDNGQNYDHESSNGQNYDHESSNGQNYDNDSSNGQNYDHESSNGQNYDHGNCNGQNYGHENFDNDIDSKGDLMSNCDNQDLYDSNLVIDENNS